MLFRQIIQAIITHIIINATSLCSSYECDTSFISAHTYTFTLPQGFSNGSSIVVQITSSTVIFSMTGYSAENIFVSNGNWVGNKNLNTAGT